MSYELFKSKAPWIMSKLMQDFPELAVDDSAAIVGNIGHECAGFRLMQEQKPTVPGSRGGYGWPQWTGPRRRAFEAYCERNNLVPSSDQANYAYLFLELKGIEGTEGGAIKKLVAAKGLEAKVKAFELAFLRAGVKHYPSRIKYAQIAKQAYLATNQVQPPVDLGTKPEVIWQKPVETETPTEVVVVEAPAPWMNRYNKAIGALIGGAVPFITLVLTDLNGVIDPDLQKALIAAFAVLGTALSSKNAS